MQFSQGLIDRLAQHREEPWTTVFQGLSLLGEVEGYVVVVALVYAFFDKRLAFRLAVLVLVAMTANHFLKMTVQNPRPFVASGDYAEKWAVSAENVRELASEFSTPSGHAMSASAFYGYLISQVRSAPVAVAAVLAILLTGLSRPYLGVHYLEDILIGWVIGGALAFGAWRYGNRFASAWNRVSPAWQVIAVFVSSLAIYTATLMANEGDAGRQPLLFVEYLGFLTGIVAASPLERRLGDFDPSRATITSKLLHFMSIVGVVTAVLTGLDTVFDHLAADNTLAGHSLKYARYAVAGFAGLFLAPLLAERLRRLIKPDAMKRQR